MFGFARWAAIRAGRALLVGALASLGPTHAFATGVDQFSYQIEFPPSPADSASAAASLDDRAKRVIGALACGSELDFAVDQHEAGEGSTGILIAKLEWITGHIDEHGTSRIAGPCTFTRYFHWFDVCARLFGKDDPKCKAPMDTVREIFRQGFAKNYFPHSQCLQPGTDAVLFDFPIPRTLRAPVAHNSADFGVVFTVSEACMLAQLNDSLAAMQVNAQMGTDGAPCNLFGTTKGDWDMSVINFTRIAFIESRYAVLHAGHILSDIALRNLQEHLLSADGGPAAESYSILTGCGNTEQNSGSSQERADDRNWTDSPFWQTIGDILWFLLMLLIVIVVAFAIVLAIATVFGLGIAGAAVAIAAAAVGVALVVNLISETENHLLMINSSTYLKDQMIIDDVSVDDPGGNRYRKDRAEVKEWLLKKMQSVMQHEFIEYNSRPYHRLSIFAIYNLADFANDDELHKAAQIVLDFETAKFAVGSQQGRRFVPFRRKRENMAARVDIDAPEANGLFDLLSGGDHQIGLGLIYTGQVQQVRDNYVSFGAAVQALYAATSRYRPDDLVLDLAIDRSTPVFQRLRHTTTEIYSSGRSYLISAGGSATGLAYTTPLSDSASITLRPALADDLGLALPTTLFLSKSILDDPENGLPLSNENYRKPDVGRTTLGDLIRIDGHRFERPNKYPSYDQNLCAWDGFACGINIVIPVADSPDLTVGFSTINHIAGEGGSCLSKGHDGAADEWSFIDSRRCAAYRHAPRFFIAIYRQACPTSSIACEDNFGFFEIKDAEADDSFDAFKAEVTNANPPGFVQTSGILGAVMKGTYHSARGQVIEFQADSTLTRHAGILSVDGVAQDDDHKWPFAQGSKQLKVKTHAPIQSSGDGQVLVTNSRLGKTLDLDFRNAAKPERTIR